MGSSQSKLPEPAVGEKLAERLHAMEVKESRNELEKGYVYLEGEQRALSESYALFESPPAYNLYVAPQYSPCSSTISISTAEQWEKELMEDPKVKCSLHSLG